MSYGCHNREPHKRTLMVQDGYHEYRDEHIAARVPLMIEVPFRMSQHCNYTSTELGKADTRCVGCKWRKEK